MFRIKIMKIVSGLFELFKKAWAVVIIVSVLFSFYTYIHEKTPNIRFTINRDTNVFDINKSVNDLDVFFLGRDIEKENLNLKIYNIKVENSGESDVLENFYDGDLPWGFFVNSGDIVSPPKIVRSSSKYTIVYL